MEPKKKHLTRLAAFAVTAFILTGIVLALLSYLHPGTGAAARPASLIAMQVGTWSLGYEQLAIGLLISLGAAGIAGVLSYVDFKSPAWLERSRATMVVMLLCGLMWAGFVVDGTAMSADMTLRIAELTQRKEESKERLATIERQFKESPAAGLATPRGFADEQRTAQALVRHEAMLKQTGVDLTVARMHALASERALEQANAEVRALNESKYYENLHFALRALALGALGALMTLIARMVIQASAGTARGEEESFFLKKNFWPNIIIYGVLGAVISVVSFGLLYTKQISIFPPNGNEAQAARPEFWRVTVLCIVAGAFADRIYQAIAVRVDEYTQQGRSAGSPRKETP